MKPRLNAYRAASFGDTTMHEAASLEDGFVSSRPSSIGKHSDKRVKKRWDSEPVPDEAIVREIIATGSRQGSRAASRGGSRGDRRSSSRQSPERPGSTSSSIARVDVWKTPESRLGQEVPIADSNTMFGSTQLSGCQGDFCNFDLAFMENQEALSSQGDRGNSLSEFRRKLLVTDSVLSQSEGSLNSHLTDLMTGKAKGRPRNSKLTHTTLMVMIASIERLPTALSCKLGRKCPSSNYSCSVISAESREST